MDTPSTTAEAAPLGGAALASSAASLTGAAPVSVAAPLTGAASLCGTAKLWELLGVLTTLGTLSSAEAPACLRQQVTTLSDQENESTTAARGGPKQRRQTAPLFRKKITNSTALRNMHVTQDMVTCLQLAEIEGEEFGGAHAQVARSPTRKPLFKHLLILRDSEAHTWPVLYESTVSARQYHRRLSRGWQDFCRYHGVQVGDTLEFQRCQQPGEAVAMRVRVVRRHGG